MSRRQHISQNALYMEQEVLEVKQKMKQLKKEITATRKQLKEFEKIKATPAELQRIIAFHEGWVTMKRVLENELLESVEQLADQVATLVEEEGMGLREMKQKNASLIEKMTAHQPVIEKLEDMFADQPRKMEYCHEFTYHLDWLKYGIEKCQAAFKILIHLRNEITEQMSRFIYKLQFQQEDGGAREKATILTEARNLIKEYLEVEDIELLKEGVPIRHAGQMTIWKFQMDSTCQQIKQHLKQNQSTVGIISTGLRKA